jgi:hypothetical protein
LTEPLWCRCPTEVTQQPLLASKYFLQHNLNDNIFAETDYKLRFSSASNRGIIQLLEYIDYCSSIQSYLRNSLNLTKFWEPKGILIIGTESDFTVSGSRERLKAAWERMAGDRLQIRTYNALVRSNPLTVNLLE